MGCVNAVALVILGILLLRKLVLMDRFFKARVYLITAFLCGLLLFFAVSFIAASEYHCASPYSDLNEIYFCPEF